MKTKTLALALTAALGVAACSQEARNETAEAGGALAADVNATTSEAVSDVSAATDRGLNAAGNAIDRTGDAIENGADRAGDRTETAADRMRASTGNAMRETGNAVDGR